MELSDLRDIVQLLAETKSRILNRENWTTDTFYSTENDVEQYCLLGSVYNGSNPFSKPSPMVDKTYEFLKQTGLDLFETKIQSVIPFFFERNMHCIVVMVNDYLGFEAVHELLDQTISRVTTLIHNYEHAPDPY